MATLEKRLGDALKSAFTAGNAILDAVVSGAGATLNLGRKLADDLDEDHGLAGWMKVTGRTPRGLRSVTGGYVGTVRAAYIFDVVIEADTDLGQDNITEDLYQAFVQTLGDTAGFFATHVIDTEGNLHVKDGDVEVEIILISGTPERPRYEAEVRISVWHKVALTQ